MGSLDREFARGAASRRLKEAERRLYGEPPKEAGRTEAPGQSREVAREGLGRAGEAARMGDDRRGRGEQGGHQSDDPAQSRTANTNHQPECPCQKTR